MNQVLFSNMALAQTNLTTVHHILDDPQALLQWVPDIDTVQMGDASDRFQIKRSDYALNDQEIIQVVVTPTKVTYLGSQGHLAYQLDFNFTEKDKQVLIEEELSVDPQETKHLPLKLLTPVAKHDFQTNLTNLVQVIEQQTV